MGSFKKGTWYILDFLRALIIKFPVNLVTTKRGWFILLPFIGATIFFWGWHFWNHPNIRSVPAPNEIEVMIEENNLNHKVSLARNETDYYRAKIYPLAQEFLERLEPGEPIFVNYALESVKWPGENESKIYAVKIYQAQESGVVYRAICGEDSNDFLHSSIRDYNLDSFNLEKLNLGDYPKNKDNALTVWLLGGIIWFCSLLVSLLRD